MKKLLDELEQIREDKKFIKYGFGAKGGHLSFIDKLKKLSKSKNKFISRKAKLLVNLSYIYAANRGIDNDKSKAIKKALNFQFEYE